MKIKELLETKDSTNEGIGNTARAAVAAGSMIFAPGMTHDFNVKDYYHPEPAIYRQDSTDSQATKNHKNVFYKIGAPYKKYGKTYHPHYDPNYKKVGIASWYGPGFHGKTTANGDIFDTNSLMAAHPTLPIPSKVWVTNLKNGKKILVTVTDRGPYAKGRLIDLSNKAAKDLGFEEHGTAKVKVEYSPEETEKYLKDTGLYDQFAKVTKSKK